jgi:hypothetical protein
MIKKETPSSLSARIRSKIRVAIFGASPNEGSSSNNRSGSIISAPAISSICCWPPESVFAPLPAFS